MTHEQFQATVRESIERFSRTRPDPNVLEGLTSNMRYVPGSFDEPRVFTELGRALGEFPSAPASP